MSMIPPKRGGVHFTYKLFIGGSALNDEYRMVSKRGYKYTTQLRNARSSQSIEKALMSARNDSTYIKFNGKLEVSSATTEAAELDKEQFISALKDKVNFHGLQTFFYMPDTTGKMTSLMDEYHALTLEEVIAEHSSRQLPEPVTVKVTKPGD